MQAPSPASGRTESLLRVSADAISEGLGCLRQTRFWRAGPRPSLPGPLYPPRCHFQPQARFLRWRECHISLARLRVWQQTENDDSLRRRIYAAVSTSHSPQGIRPHPSLWRPGQLPALRVYRSVPETSADDSPGPIGQHSLVQHLLALPSMSESLDPRPEAHCSPALLAAFKKSVHRLFLMPLQRNPSTCSCTPAPTCVHTSRSAVR